MATAPPFFTPSVTDDSGNAYPPTDPQINLHDAPLPAAVLARQRALRLVERFWQRWEDGEQLECQQLLRDYPEMLGELRGYFAALEQLQQAANDSGLAGVCGDSGGEARVGAMIGEFRLLREVGRGGMGIVFEAEQVSLRRRVALKVLPFAAGLDQRQLERFRREAQAAAQLHHPHIVPVYMVGASRGVHYFSMQFIVGRSLAEWLDQLRRQRDRVLHGLVTPPVVAASQSSSRFNPLHPNNSHLTPPSQELPGVAHQAEALAGAAVAERRLRETDVYHPEQASTDQSRRDGADLSMSAPVALADSHPEMVDLSTNPSSGVLLDLFDPKNPQAYYRQVARLGLQAAEALDHAHAHGILHRDIKPGNLLLDDFGHLWIADFGLAKVLREAGAELTASGDLLGTIRYMSPEQALGKRVPLDQRSDIYSLGATLFELITLRPLVDGQDKQEILHQIATEEPKPARKLAPLVPVDLETILLKATAKTVDARYHTMQEFAEDLRAFLEHRPIHASRPCFWDRFGKWVRRHQTLAGAAVVTLLFVLLCLSWTTWFSMQQRQRAEQAQQLSAFECEQARQAKKRALEAFRQTRTMVDLLAELTARHLRDMPALQPVRQKLLRMVEDFYRRIIDDHQGQPGEVFDVAYAHFHLGKVYDQLGASDRALAEYEAAQKLYQQQFGHTPHPVHLVDLIVLYDRIGRLHHQMGNSAAALAALRESTELLDQLNQQRNRQTGTGKSGQVTNAEPELVLPQRHAREFVWSDELDVVLRRACLGDCLAPEEPIGQHLSWATAHTNELMGRIEAELGQLDQSLQSHQKEYAAWQRILQEFPDQPCFMNHLADCCRRLAVVHCYAGNWHQAQASLQEAVTLRERLVTIEPDGVEFQQQLARDREELIWVQTALAHATNQNYESSPQAALDTKPSDTASHAGPRLPVSADTTAASSAAADQAGPAASYLGRWLPGTGTSPHAKSRSAPAATLVPAPAEMLQDLETPAKRNQAITPSFVDSWWQWFNWENLKRDLVRDWTDRFPANATPSPLVSPAAPTPPTGLLPPTAALPLTEPLVSTDAEVSRFLEAPAGLGLPRRVDRLWERGAAHVAELDIDRAASSIEELQEELAKTKQLVLEHPEVPGHRHRLGRLLVELGMQQNRAGGSANWEAALRHAKEAVDLLSSLVREKSEPAYRFQLALAYNLTGVLVSKKDDHDYALDCYSSAKHLLSELIQQKPNHKGYQHLLARVYNNWAWQLVTTPELAARDPHQAVRYAEQACILLPHDSRFTNTLGVAYCRAGQYKEAVKTLLMSARQQREMGLSPAIDLAFLVLCYHHLQQQDLANQTYREFLVQMRDPNQAQDPDLKRIHQELLATITKLAESKTPTDNSEN